MDNDAHFSRLEALRDEALRIEEDAQHSAKGHFVAAERWRHVHLWLGIPAAVGAGVAGVSAFASLTTAAGVVSFLVAALTATTTFLNPGGRADTHTRAGNGYIALRNKTRIYRTAQLPNEEPKTLTKRLLELSTQRDELNGSSVQIPRWAYQEAKRRMAAGEAEYAVGNGKRKVGVITPP